MKPRHLFLMAAGILLPQSAISAVTSHDSFEIGAGAYTVGEVPGQNPSIDGYSGAWTDVDFGNAEPAVTAGSLVYGNSQYIGSSGGHVANLNTTDTQNTVGRSFRVLDSTLAVNGTTNGVRYLSFLFQNGNNGTAVYQALGLYNGTTADANRAFEVGNASSNFGSTDFGFRVNDNNATRDTFAAIDSTVHLFVVKFDLSSAATSDSVTVWFDPTLGGEGDPTGGTTFSGLDLQFDRLALSKYGSNTAAWDEIRWGTDFNSITIPEPSAALLGGLGMLALLRRRRN
jgi:hypothetical protein